MTDDASKKRAAGFAAAKELWLKLIASYPNLSGADVAIAVMLSTYMNTKTRDAWPSMQRLARDTNRTRSTVWRSLKRLEELKLLRITHARSSRKPNRYQPLMGSMIIEPKMLGRKTTARGLMLRTRNINAANSQHISCDPAALTSEEPLMKSRSMATRAEVGK
jgi:Helix-turn-helix domain